MPECPVCGTDVPESDEVEGYGETADEYGDETASPPTMTYEGTEYVLCGSDHAKAFRSEPTKYV